MGDRVQVQFTMPDIYLGMQPRPQLGVEARAGPFQVASTHGDGYVLPRTRHPMMMMMMSPCPTFAPTIFLLLLGLLSRLAEKLVERK